jgi:tripeptide aminopeptidase
VLTRDADVTQLFCELAAIPSPSGRERALGEQIQAWLAAHGVTADFDGTGERNDSDAGNLLATVTGPTERPTLLFVAHMDTVESGEEPVRPWRDGDTIRSASETILGADNKSAVAALMCCLRSAQQRPADQRPTIIGAFTCREESGRMGASLLDLDGLGVDHAFSVDGSQPIGTVTTRALGQRTFVVSVHGRGAHAAADPESGVNAIAVAAEAIAVLPLGRLPGGGSVNVAAIVGGSALDAPVRTAPTNSVPDIALVRGEVRGYTTDDIDDTARAIRETFARACDARGAECQWTLHRGVPPLPGAADSGALALVRAAAERIDGVVLDLREAHATLEANYLAPHVDVVAVASGGSAPHQTSESITVGELRALEALLGEIVSVGNAEQLGRQRER